MIASDNCDFYEPQYDDNEYEYTYEYEYKYNDIIIQ